MNRRHVIFGLFFLTAFLMAYGPIKALYDSSSQSEYYSHIALIPLVSLYLVFQKRKLIFLKEGSTNDRGVRLPRNSHVVGVSLLVAGALLYFIGRDVGADLDQNDITVIVVLATVVFINGGFIVAYGLTAFKAALFPLLFLVFMIPVPSALMDGVVYFLQLGSTEFTHLLFLATGVPFLREGFVFHLPGISIEVAKECSGIRSSLALMITAILAGHLFLETRWKKVILTVAIVPITMLKNGFRILILTLMGTYWDPRWLTNSRLHHEGGILFFILALVLMAPILYFLKKSEEKKGESK